MSSFDRIDDEKKRRKLEAGEEAHEYYGQASSGEVLGKVSEQQQQTNLTAVANHYNELANNPELAQLLQQEASKQAMYGNVMMGGPMIGLNGGMYRMAPEMMTMTPMMEEEPLYVNAKQYNRILKRRQARAKLESQIRAHKSQEKAPYMHESRHRHAMKRPRGPGGRFLTAAEIAELKANEAAEKANGTAANTNGKKEETEKTDSDTGSNTSQANIREKVKA